MLGDWIPGELVLIICMVVRMYYSYILLKQSDLSTIVLSTFTCILLLIVFVRTSLHII